MQSYIYNIATGRYKGFVPQIIKIFLFVLSLIYGLVIRILVFICRMRPRCLKCKVIGIGNITVGGTGKTTLVEYIARYLNTQGHKVAILSRGYKRTITSDKIKMVNYKEMGDEPYMLKMNLEDVPVIVDRNRIRGSKRAIDSYKVDTLVLDDSFQQWRIKKDLEIVTIDATNPFGNWHMIPRGILREPLSSLKRADIFFLTKINVFTDIQGIRNILSRINPRALIIESVYEPQGFYVLGKRQDLFNTDILKGKTVTLFSGIADPASFENLITGIGINIGLSFHFPDHYDYSQKDLDNIISESRKKDIDAVVTTEKDAARLYLLPNICYSLPIYILRIKLKITQNEEGFHNRLFRLYNA